MEAVHGRRSERLLLSFPIRVDGAEPSGSSFSETTRTLVINRHGARIQLKRQVQPGQTLHIVNLVGNREADFRVVGPTQPYNDQGGEWGVECREEGRNVWGIEFPPSEERELPCSALLECRRCHQVRLTPMSVVELDVLESSGLLTKECGACQQPTSWGYVQKQVGFPARARDADPAVAEAFTPPPPTSDRRATRRVPLRLPIRVRSWLGGEELTKSENVSKDGLAFISDKQYEIGEALQVTCPYDPGGENIELRGRVVRRSGTKGGRLVYGVRYERAA